jgi:hypothetical protein
VAYVARQQMCAHSDLKIWIFQTTSNGETLNMKVVDPKKLWNFVVYTFLFEIILSMKFKFESLKFEIQIL